MSNQQHSAICSSVSVLFARGDSVYNELCDDVWDVDRDARNWPGGRQIVAHPPCGPWGQLAGMCNATQAEKDLGPWAVEQVRKWGGALEHPIGSKLWRHCGVYQNGTLDEFGGFSIIFAQWWFGHKAEKWTRIYFCGITHDQLPPVPFKIGEASHCIAQSRKNQRLRARPEVTKPEREHTPRGLAIWLLQTAALCRPAAAYSKSSELVNISP